MNREIKFRGFHECDGPETVVIDGEVTRGRWVVGFYWHSTTAYGDDVHAIAVIENSKSKSFDVLPATVGQFTGLLDRNGREIFEGDRVRCTDTSSGVAFVAVVEFGNPNGNYSWGFQLRPITPASGNTDILLWVEMDDVQVFCEVLGTVFDKVRQGGDGMSELKSCPFCGGEGIYVESYQHSAGLRWRAVCLNCMATVDPGYIQQKCAAIETWNRRASGWVKCSERLPELGTDVLLWDGDGYYADGDAAPVKATHWMPLPEPPEVDE